MYSDQETGLYYWYSRYYDPKTGRGIQPDRMSVAEHVQRWQANMGSPVRLPLEINPYVYVANNPLRWIDPLGLSAFGIAGDFLLYGGGIVTAAGVAIPNPYVIGAGLGMVGAGGALQYYDQYLEGQDAKSAIDKAQQTVDQLNEIQKEKQRQIDKLFPPKPTPPDCP